jgi:hypothetical protein
MAIWLASADGRVQSIISYTESAAGAHEDHDEYEDDDDPGYVREDIRGQEAFIARELDISDEDGSGRGADVYHQAIACRSQARLPC